MGLLFWKGALLVIFAVYVYLKDSSDCALCSLSCFVQPVLYVCFGLEPPLSKPWFSEFAIILTTEPFIKLQYNDICIYNGHKEILSMENGVQSSCQNYSVMFYATLTLVIINYCMHLS